MSQISSPVSFLYMPLDGVAAYWLSLRKLLGSGRNMKALEMETQFIGEPFARNLMSMLITQLTPERYRRLASVCGNSEIYRLNRQLDLMRIAVMDVATGENPLRTLTKMTSLFPAPLPDPESMLETGQSYVAAALEGALAAQAYRVDHHMTDEALSTALLFYVTLCRRHGKAACRAFLPQKDSLFFTDALSLVVDGFDSPFIRKWMKKYKGVLLADMQRKIDMSIEMCTAIHERMSFEDMRFLVRSYIR